jgi:hypothetical protein
MRALLLSRAPLLSRRAGSAASHAQRRSSSSTAARGVHSRATMASAASGTAGSEPDARTFRVLVRVCVRTRGSEPSHSAVRGAR